MIDHEHFIRQTLKLAGKGIGKTATNPMVGAILVKLENGEGRIITKGYHTGYGKPHAEVEVIRRAKRMGVTDFSNTILYVNLEPCCHHGKTPPCTDLIIQEKIPHVVFGTLDPFKAVSGKGAAQLKDAGIKVEFGFLENDCMELNKVFFKHIRTQLPWVTLKFAQSIDGKIATRSGDSKWISSEASRRYVHQLRTEYDAVLVGAQTVSKDNPQLNVRLAKGRDPKRIIVDGRLRIPLNANVVKGNDVSNTIILTAKNSNRKKIDQLIKRGVHIYEFPAKKFRFDLKAALRKLLKEEKIASILAEGGSVIHGELLKSKLADDVILIIAPKIIGSGVSSVTGQLTKTIGKAVKLNSFSAKPMDRDIVIQARIVP
ncbi:bifunctional diaminohydroxyphosphoribosylaminopyrimidine deaminase/5-amino-6-(5-phosphoribosylamino)uracil reductase RibD [bacterium]|nr:MAG: bifunctional diaminohydroxyphosphoribosylaminopyrimidine deaminase/5-amino-6-(5-phosphoribosylamino)uracil reductase RibD [bacterium]